VRPAVGDLLATQCMFGTAAVFHNMPPAGDLQQHRVPFVHFGCLQSQKNAAPLARRRPACHDANNPDWVPLHLIQVPASPGSGWGYFYSVCLGKVYDRENMVRLHNHRPSPIITRPGLMFNAQKVESSAEYRTQDAELVRWRGEMVGDRS